MSIASLITRHFTRNTASKMKHVNSVMSIVCFILAMACVALFIYALFERHEIDPSYLLFIVGGLLASRVFLKRAKTNKENLTGYGRDVSGK